VSVRTIVNIRSVPKSNC